MTSKSEIAVRLGVLRSKAKGDKICIQSKLEIGDKLELVWVSGEGVNIAAFGFSLLLDNTYAPGMNLLACGFKGIADKVKFEIFADVVRFKEKILGRIGTDVVTSGINFVCI